MLTCRCERWNPEFDDIRPLVEDIVTWRRRDVTWVGGRTAAFTPDAPQAVGRVEVLKIKGLGSFNDAGKATPPTLETYHAWPWRRDHLHLGFTPEGGLSLVSSRIAPVGGLTLGRALNEYELSERLFQHHVPCIHPIGVYAYPDLVFDTKHGAQALGVVITGMPEVALRRLWWVVSYDAATGPEVGDPTLAEFLRDYASEAVGPDVAGFAEPDQRMRLIARLYSRVGLALRQFTEAGLYRYSCHLGNFAFADDEAHLILIDLDSSDRIESVPEHLRALQVVRDISSGLYHLSCDYVRPQHLHLSATGEIEEANAYGHFLGGYFDGPPERFVDMCAPLLRYVLSVRARVDRWMPAMHDLEGSGRRLFHDIFLDEPLAFGLAFRAAFLAYAESDLVDRWPLPFGTDDLVDQLHRFGGDVYLARIAAGTELLASTS